MIAGRGRRLVAPEASVPSPAGAWLPWWCRPSLMLLGASIPALAIFSFSDASQSLARAQHFYEPRDFLLGLVSILVLAAGAALGESGLLPQAGNALLRRRPAPSPRLGETLLSTRFDAFLMAVFLVSHLIFFRGFLLNPGLAGAVLGGNLELKHTFKTIPGVTTWTQVAIVLGGIRGMRWSGLLPGRVKLVSVFHLVFFGTLFVRALLWSERLALIEGGVPFFLGALPRICAAAGPFARNLLRLLPLLLPVAVLLLFVSFEFLRSWQHYSGQHSSIFEFGWKRLYTYYFEAMNTGAAVLRVAGFYDGPTAPLSHKAHEDIYEGLYLGTLDVEYNNPGGLHYIAARTGNLLLGPFLLLVGIWFGLTYRAYREGRLLSLLYPISFLGLMEILRIPYWIGTNRVVPAVVVVALILLWSASLRRRVRLRPAAEPADQTAAAWPLTEAPRR
jgi:hypothetical protein